MSSDLAKLGFIIWPSSKFTKLYKGKISGFWAQESWNFFNRTVSKLWAIEILMFFKMIGPNFFWSFTVGTSTDCHSFISEYFHSTTEHFTVNCKVACWTKQSFSLVTFELLVNCCYKITCFSCAFKHDNILNTYG